MDLNLLGIIPARGGSKGLPGKNIKNLNGLPLIAYTIISAIKSKMFSKVIVNTDDNEIAQIAQKYGAEVPFIRPALLAEDSSSTIDVVKHTINWFEEKNLKFSTICLLQPTSPLRTDIHIKEAINLFVKKGADSVISTVELNHPIYWVKNVDESGLISDIFNKEESNLNRQSYRKNVMPNGAIYLFKSDLLKNNSLYTDHSFSYEMDKKSSIDIDNLDDFEYCEFLLRSRNA